MEPIERFPVVPFPSASEGEIALSIREAGQMQQSQHRVINLVSVGLQRGSSRAEAASFEEEASQACLTQPSVGPPGAKGSGPALGKRRQDSFRLLVRETQGLADEGAFLLGELSLTCMLRRMRGSASS